MIDTDLCDICKSDDQVMSAQMICKDKICFECMNEYVPMIFGLWIINPLDMSEFDKPKKTKVKARKDNG